ncbi:NUDIX hydrolase [methane-oxidizing endosymbiont of Gigantopelta aegis]|uniref:NUDIX hydrolase n=1 Tax=methane-oxidizing endosymbiont of Gigantopelta aegis TaxID=2794938 RepID=UPI0018DCD212|nr:NUDIX domain-containing protein [methane-oxidizing endosymbiont of Gigantopelta aegis]
MRNNELLAVVDDNDSIIEHQPRQFIHRHNLKHRAVHILVFNSQNQLFLQKRSLTKDLNPGLWDTSAAGHVDKGENYDMAAVRELHEELGIQTEALTLLFKLEPTPALGMEFIQVYHCVHDGPFELAADEIDDGHWSPIDQITQRVNTNDPSLTQTFKTIWRHYLSQT